MGVRVGRVRVEPVHLLGDVRRHAAAVVPKPETVSDHAKVAARSVEAVTCREGHFSRRIGGRSRRGPDHLDELVLVDRRRVRGSHSGLIDIDGWLRAACWGGDG